MPDPEETPGSRRQDLVRRLARPVLALAGVIVFRLLFASVLHHPVLHQAPVAGRSPLAQAVSGHGGGTVRLVAEPTAGAAYLDGANLSGPLAVLATYAAAGAVLTLAATAWRRHRPASRALQHAAQAADAAAEASLAS